MTEQELNKTNQVLADVSSLLKSGLLSKGQILELLELPPQEIIGTQSQPLEKISLQKILYYIGGFIVFFGIVFFFYQFWDNMSQVAKTLLTLGSAISAYSLGYYFFVTRKSRDFGHAFLIISAALFPLGIGTFLDTVGISATTTGGMVVISTVLFIIFYISYYYIKASIFLPFSIIAASSLFINFTNYILADSGTFSHFDEYRALILGLAYISIGYYFSQGDKKFITNLLYVSGLFMSLGASLALQGYSPNSDLLWTLIYPFLLVFTFWGSMKLQSKVFLVMATIFTFAEISKLTAEYFSESIGWPISLIIAGLFIMGIGYMSFELNKKILRQSNYTSTMTQPS